MTVFRWSRCRSSLTPVAGQVQLPELGIIDRDELPGVGETLDAAALTLLAAFVASLASSLSADAVERGRRERLGGLAQSDSRALGGER